jgi:hypothetical protein
MVSGSRYGITSIHQNGLYLLFYILIHHLNFLQLSELVLFNPVDSVFDDLVDELLLILSKTALKQFLGYSYLHLRAVTQERISR